MAGFGITPPYIHPLSKPQPNAGGRQAAIAHHMGAPKRHAQPKQKAPKPQSKPKAAPRPPKLGSSQKAIGDLNPGDVHNRAVTTSRLERNAALAPLQTQATQIGANEAGVQAKYGQLVGAQDVQAQHLQEGQAASAKTFENQAAENALTAGKAIETAGQTQASMTGGYTSPELRAQMALSSQQAAGQGGAGSAFAQSVAASGASNIAQMRAAASLGAGGGSQQITNAFQKQLGQNQIAQQGVIAKTGARQGELEEKIGQANFSDRQLKEKLTSEGVYKKAALEAKDLASRRTAATSRANSERTRAGTAESNATRKQIAAENRFYKETHPTGSATGRKGGGKPVKSPASAAKFLQEVSSAESAGRQVFNQTGKKSLYSRKRQEQVRHYLAGRGASGDVISATLNLLVYGKLGPKDRKTVEAYGVNPEKAPPGWFS